MNRMHPLDPLQPCEIGLAADLVRRNSSPQFVHFKHITLVEPPKKVLREFLKSERTQTPFNGTMKRKATVLYLHRSTTNLFVATVDLDETKIEAVENLDPRYLPHADMAEVTNVRDACMSHPSVQARITEYGLPDNFNVVCDTWPYGRDTGGLFDRKAQVMFPHSPPRLTF